MSRSGLTARWQLTFTGEEPPLAQLPHRWMYVAAFPKTKVTSPRPDMRLSGIVEINGETTVLDGWRGTEWPGYPLYCRGQTGSTPPCVDAASLLALRWTRPSHGVPAWSPPIRDQRPGAAIGDDRSALADFGIEKVRS